MWMAKKETGAPSPVRPPSRMKRFWRRAAAITLAATLLSGGMIASAPQPAEALTRGEGVSFPYVGLISNFVRPDNPADRVYCLEVQMGEPSGSASYAGRLTWLPGRAGMFSSYDNPDGMMWMNSIIDRHGRTGNHYMSSLVQIAVWAIRGDTAYYNDKLPKLLKSDVGRAAVNDAQALINEAKRTAKRPGTPKGLTGTIKLEKDPQGRANVYRLPYQKGTVKLEATNGKWLRNDAAVLAVPGDVADARYVRVTNPNKPVTVTASWSVTGTLGYEPTLFVWDTQTSNGTVAQRVGVATGASTKKPLTGKMTTSLLEERIDFPLSYSLAQKSANTGGTVGDSGHVEAVPGTTPKIWENAVLSFDAYLTPEDGAVKVDNKWQPVLGDPYQAQAEDPESGEALWTTWWTRADGTPLLDAEGNKIPVADGAGNPTSGTAADGTPYPVPQLDTDGEPVLDGHGNPKFFTDREAVMEERRDPVRWTKAEIEAMTAAQLCVAQPVYHEEGIPVTKVGVYNSQKPRANTAGKLNWVHKITSNGQVVGTNSCGQESEVSRIGQPTIETNAPLSVKIGEVADDPSEVFGTLDPLVKYEARWDAYSIPLEYLDDPTSVTPVCEAANRVYRSDRIAINTAGKLTPPGVMAQPEHGAGLWWVHSFYTVDAAGDSHLLERGECGDPSETTVYALPEFSTTALQNGLVGDYISDVLNASNIVTTPETSYSVTYAGFKPAYEEMDSLAANPAPGEEKVMAPVCNADNRLVQLDPQEVPGDGSHKSSDVFAGPDFEGDVWWQATVTLHQGDKDTVVFVGECADPTEITNVKGPKLTTTATGTAVMGDYYSDLGKIEGTLPQREGVSYDLVYEGFKGDPALTGTDKATCTADNRLFTLDPVALPAEAKDANGVEVREAQSPQVRAVPTHGDTVWWVATLRQHDGDKVTDLKVGVCGDVTETTTLTMPSVRTESMGTTQDGGLVWDNWIVEGRFPKSTDAEYRVTVMAYEYVNGKIVCTPEYELPRFADKEGKAVTKAGTYESKKVRSERGKAVVGGFVEAFTLTVDRVTYQLPGGKCGEPSERFEVEVPVDELSVTGGMSSWMWGAAGVGILALGAMAITVARLNRRSPAPVRDCADMTT